MPAEMAAQTEAMAEKLADTQPKLVGSDLGIPGGKQINLLVAFAWSICVGWVFSTVGAFGGVLAGCFSGCACHQLDCMV